MLRNNVMSSPGQYAEPEMEGGGTPAQEWYSQSGRETPTNMNYYDANNQMGGATMGGNVYGDEDDDEIPLLEELGVRPDQILVKLQCVLNPSRRIEKNILDDADLAGPILFCLCLGSCLLLTGKINFGYIYGFSVISTILLHCMLNLLHHSGINFWLTASVLGYSLMPVIILAAFSIIFSMRGIVGLTFSCCAIAWSTFSAIRMFDAKLSLAEQYWLVVYPVALLYSCFTLISIF